MLSLADRALGALGALESCSGVDWPLVNGQRCCSAYLCRYYTLCDDACMTTTQITFLSSMTRSEIDALQREALDAVVAIECDDIKPAALDVRFVRSQHDADRTLVIFKSVQVGWVIKNSTGFRTVVASSNVTGKPFGENVKRKSEAVTAVLSMFGRGWGERF